MRFFSDPHSVSIDPMATQVDPGKPEQYCTLHDVIGNGTTLRVGEYPVAWKIEAAKEYPEYEYVRSA